MMVMMMNLWAIRRLLACTTGILCCFSAFTAPFFGFFFSLVGFTLCLVEPSILFNMIPIVSAAEKWRRPGFVMSAGAGQ